MAILVSLSGLPGVGKTTVARILSARSRALHLRVDSVEAALRRSVLNIHPAEDAGYLALAAVAEDNLRLGFDVIADTVNPIGISRELWAGTAAAASAALLNVEIICSDKTIHRARVEARRSDTKGLAVPDWAAVSARRFERWRTDRLVVDTCLGTAAECAAAIAAEMAKLRSPVR